MSNDHMVVLELSTNDCEMHFTKFRVCNALHTFAGLQELAVVTNKYNIYAQKEGYALQEILAII